MTAEELIAYSAELTTDIATAEGITEQAVLRGMIADAEGQELVAAIHERKTEQALLRGLIAAADAFDHMKPLPPLKQHPREQLWEPAAVRYRDLPGGEAK